MNFYFILSAVKKGFLIVGACLYIFSGNVLHAQSLLQDPEMENKEWSSFFVESFMEVQKSWPKISIANSRPNNSTQYHFIAIITINGSSVICPGQLVTLSANGNIACSYLWTTGQTTSSITISNPGTYGLTINCKKGNGGSSVAAPVTIGSNTLITDLNDNGVVDVLDYIDFLGDYLTTCPGCREDFVVDGIVDTRDYLRWVADIQKTCY